MTSEADSRSTVSDEPIGATIQLSDNHDSNDEDDSHCQYDDNSYNENMSLEQVDVTATSSATNATRQVTGTPLDIAQSSDEKPVQPHNAAFPKESGRSFSPSWFAKHTWLEYSVSKDAAYCYPCRFFSTGVQKGDECFISTGYRNWKKATGMSGRLRKHTLSQRHGNAFAAWSDYLRNQQSQTSIASSLNQVRKEQIQHNRHYMKTVIEILMYCALHEVALRGHREGVDARNRGKFLGLLDMIIKHDLVVKNRLQHGPKNAVYTSHSVQDDLLRILGNNVVQIICGKVREAGLYSVIVDESRDSSKQEQMSFAVCFVDTKMNQFMSIFSLSFMLRS